VIGCAIDDDVAVCTCLIVVAVANATATPKATMSAVKANFGPMMRPPISISLTPRPAYGQPVQRFKSRLEPDPPAGSRLARSIASRGLERPFNERFIESIGTRTGGRSCSASAKSSGFQFPTTIILLLDLAFL
jgi:hypothetical protein